MVSAVQKTCFTHMCVIRLLSVVTAVSEMGWSTFQPRGALDLDVPEAAFRLSTDMKAAPVEIPSSSQL